MSLLSTLIADASRIDKNSRSRFSPCRLAVTSVPFRAVLIYRLAAALYPKLPAASRILHQLNIISHGADIDPRCQIGEGLLLQHPVGTVVGGGAKIGARCTMMGGVVLGRRNVKGGDSPFQYPQLGSDVLVGAGACILGAVIVGDRSTVGAMALVLNDIPSDSVAVGNPANYRAVSRAG